METNNHNDADQPKAATPTMEETKPSIGPSSTIQISLLVSLVGGLIAFTWFVRGLQAQVQTVQSDVASIRMSVQELNRVGNMAADLRELKQYGSDVARSLQGQLAELRRDFELHKAQTLPK